MCGIAGIVGLSSSDEASERLHDMLDAMAHRGPDGAGALRFCGGAAGMVRLALVDLSARGQQPLWSDNKLVAILFNGEIYNFRELRTDLQARGHSFHTGTDTEVILALYLDASVRFTERLRGMYAVAILDFRERGPAAPPDVHLARGPFGMKPLYVYSPASGVVVFGSELRALLASGLVPNEIDTAGLRDFLRYGFVVQPKTMFRGVRMLDPGTLETWSPGKPMTKRATWSWAPTEPRVSDLESGAREFRAVLEESIRLHALADAPVGAFLSGGVDSAGIVALMRPHVDVLNTYTLRFVDVPGADEAAEAEAIARATECECNVVEVASADVPDLMPRFAADLDSPSTDGFNTWLLSRAAARDVKAVLSGLGGDEWFSGYPTAIRMMQASSTLLGRTTRAAGIAAHALPETCGWLPDGVGERADNLAARRSLLAIWIHGHKVFSPAIAAALCGAAPDNEDETISRILDEVAPWWRDAYPLEVATLLDARLYMGCQLLRDSDATSMAHSLELRAPYVDREVAAFARSCVPRIRATLDDVGPRPQKRVLIEALRGAIPRDVVNRPKRGFVLPYETWMNGALKQLVLDTVHPRAVRNRGVLDPFIVGRLFERDDGDTQFPKLWSLLTLELWFQGVVDKAAEKPRRHAASIIMSTPGAPA